MLLPSPKSSSTALISNSSSIAAAVSIAPITIVPNPVVALCSSSRVSTGIAGADYTIIAISSTLVLGPPILLGRASKLRFVESDGVISSSVGW